MNTATRPHCTVSKINTAGPHKTNGFTLTELLVVIATLAILQLLLIPALSRSKPVSAAVICQNNVRQLTLGWQLYSTENRDAICRTGGMEQLITDPSDFQGKPGGTKSQWCLGTVSITPIATDDRFIRIGLLFPYINQLAAYKCPLDTNAFSGKPTVRSFSMNCWMNPITPWGSVSTRTSFRKQIDVLHPSSTFVIMDEDPRLINDGWFIVDPAQPTKWVDIPTSNHDGGASISFADGHVELKKWTDKKMLDPSATNNTPADPLSKDLQWLQTCATY